MPKTLLIILGVYLACCYAYGVFVLLRVVRARGQSAPAEQQGGSDEAGQLIGHESNPVDEQTPERRIAA